MPSAHDARTATVSPAAPSAHRVEVSASQAARYALATNDVNDQYAALGIAPPVFAAVVSWDVLVATLTDLVAGQPLTHVLHRAQDMYFHRPLPVGHEVLVTGRIAGIRALPSAAQVCTHLAASDGEARPLFDIFCTTLIRGIEIGAASPIEAPSHRLPAAVRTRSSGDAVVHIDDDQPVRYSEASGDRNPIHLDEQAAQAAGFPGVILHGLCAMAMCGAAVVKAAAGDDPTRLARLAVRFSAPVFPGEDMRLVLYKQAHDEGRKVVRFEAAARGRTALKDGLAEIRC